MVTRVLKYSIFILIAFLFLYVFYMLFIFKGYNPQERNKLVFEDDIQSVEDSITVFNNLVKDYYYFWYAVDRDDFKEWKYENLILFLETKENESNKIGYLKDSLLYKKIDTLRYKLNNPERFVSIILSFYKNHLYSVIKNGDLLLFLYREDIDMGDRQEDLERYVVFVKDKSDLEYLLKDNFVNAASGGSYNLAYKIIDHKANLYLLAHKNAKIWEN